MSKLKTLITKTILSCLIFILLTFSLTPTAYAQVGGGSWYNQSFPEWFSKVYGSPDNEIFGERYTAAQVQWIFYSIISQVFLISQQLSQCIFSGELTACFSQPAGSAQSTLARQPINKNLLQVIFEDRPLSGITYTKDVFRKFHLIPEASAQEGGFGFQRLDPILPLWRTARNFAYAIFVLVTVVFAFMIMFRVKISPQVVVTVQSAIPKIAVSIILVTFSYAIAGFLVDLMYVFIGLISLFFSPGQAPQMFSDLTRGFAIPGGAVYAGVFGWLIAYLVAAFIVLAIVLFAEVGLIGILTGAGAALIAVVGLTAASGGGLLLLLGLVLAIVMLLLILFILWQFFRTVWMLIKAFASILLLTFVAPFQIALGAVVPSFGFGSWLKSFIGNLAVFPVAGFLMVLSFRFLGISFKFVLEDFIGGAGLWDEIATSVFGIVFTQTVSGTASPSWPPLLGGDVLLPLIFVGASIVVFSIIPRTAELVKSAIEGKPFAYGTAIGEALYPWPVRKGMESMPVRAYREAAGREIAASAVELLKGLGGLVSPKIKKQLGDIESGLRRGRA